MKANLDFLGLHILAVSPVSSYGGSNTSVHRINAMKALGLRVEVIDSTIKSLNLLQRVGRRAGQVLFGFGPPYSLQDSTQVGSRLIKTTASRKWDIIWLEKALVLDATTLIKLKQRLPRALIVGYSCDDMYGTHNQSRQFLESLPYYDVFLTTKSYNVPELKLIGCPEVLFVGNGYDPKIFRPMTVTAEERVILGSDVSFIGSFEEDRATIMHYLARNGLTVRIWGNGWNHMKQRHANLIVEYRPVFGDEFAKVCSATKINLGFLRKLNRDLQTTRSVEIPACGGFMLAERTKEHMDLFNEGEEAEFFDSPEELLAKCRYYLANPVIRERLAAAGLQRCLCSGYSNQERLAALFPKILSISR